MKKNLLSAFILISAALSAAAQTFFTEDFQAAPPIPAGWSQQLPASVPNNKGWQFGTTVGGALGSSVPAHTKYAFVNDYDNNAAGLFNRDSLYTSMIDMSSYAHVYLSLDLWFFGGYITLGGTPETAYIAVSNDGGITYTNISGSIPGDPTAKWRTGLTYDITPVAAGNDSVKIAFIYSDNGNRTYAIGIDNIKCFVPTTACDMTVKTQQLSYYVKKNTSNAITGTIMNLGYTTTTDMHLNYSIDGAAPVTDTLTSISIPALATYTFTHSIPWAPTVPGIYTMRIWTDSINGNTTDQLHTNDTLKVTFRVFDSLVVKTPLLEEFTQASCDPCAKASPNLDSVLWNNQGICNVVRYHVNWPGRDFMNQVTQTPFVATRVSYYGVTGVPHARLDGAVVQPGTVKSPDIKAQHAVGTPFTIDLSSATYNTVLNSYSVTVDVKSFADYPTGQIIAQVALTVDTITYKSNQSTQSIPQYEFNEVAEAMMPGGGGTALAAFTSGQTQSINVGWVKNHPWGNTPKTWIYDSTSVTLIAWVQDKTSKYVYQSASIVPTVFTDVEQVSSGIGMGIFPNPCTDHTTVSVTLQESKEIKMEVYNMLGETIYSMEKSKLNAGTSYTGIDASGLNNGVYFVKISSGSETHTQKFIVNK